MLNELTDEQWKRIKAVLPAREGTAGRKGKDDCAFVRAVLWISRSGSSCKKMDYLVTTAYEAQCKIEIACKKEQDLTFYGTHQGLVDFSIKDGAAFFRSNYSRLA